MRAAQECFDEWEELELRAFPANVLNGRSHGCSCLLGRTLLAVLPITSTGGWKAVHTHPYVLEAAAASFDSTNKTPVIVRRQESVKVELEQEKGHGLHVKRKAAENITDPLSPPSRNKRAPPYALDWTYKDHARNAVMKNCAGHKLHPSRVNMGALKEWLQQCIDHPGCRSSESISVPNFRLIDCATRQVISAPSGVAYCALSYLWSFSYNEKDSETSLHSERTPQVINNAIEGHRHLASDISGLIVTVSIKTTNHTSKNKSSAWTPSRAKSI